VFRRSSVEWLEDRRVLAAPALASSLPLNFTMQSGTAFQIPLDGFDADNDALTYSVSVNSSTVSGFNQSFRTGDLLQIQYQQTGGAAISGTMLFKLFEDLAPRTTAHIKQLASSGFYNDVIFHRILNGFVIQGGDPTGTGSGGSNLGDFDDEYDPLAMHTQTGLLSMAKSTDDSNDSQFFITEGPQRHLDFNHTVYGMLIEGEQAREQLSNVPVNSPNVGRPVNDVHMTNVQVVADRQNGVLTVVAPNGSTGTVSLTVTVRDPAGGTAQLTFTINVTSDALDSTPYLEDAQNPQKITLSHNGSQIITLHATDVDGGPLRYLDRAGLAAIPMRQGVPRPEAEWLESIRLPQQNPNLTVQVTPTGQLTVTAANGISGVFEIIVGVTNQQGTADANVDTQIIPVYVNPPTPTLDLLPISDTGSSDSDNVTRLNNSDGSSTLQFQVGNVVPGATVKIFAGTTLIGQATAPTTGGTSLTITTNGTAALANGLNNITATQERDMGDVAIANFREENVVLTSAASTPLPLTVDRTAPSITIPSIPLALPGQLLTIDIASNEEGNDGFQFALIQRPDGAAINAATGVITWTPNVSQAGVHQFTVGTTDKAGNTSQQNFEVRVNSPPQLQPIQNQGVGIGVELAFLVSTLDNDIPNDTLTYSLTSAPVGATITPAANFQGQFRWTPTGAQAGLHSITVRVTDAAGQFSEQTFQVTVDDPEPPQLDAIPDDTVDELAPFTFDANATDANLPNDTLVFSFGSSVPTGMTINAQTGVISWTPAEADGPQSYTISVRVTDAFQLTDEEEFVLNVSEVNTPPFIPPIDDKIVNAGSELRFTIVATDADLPAQDLGFSLVSAPAGALIDPVTGEFVWTPGPSAPASVETVTVRVQDAAGEFADRSFNVRVNVAPQIDPITDRTVDEGQTLTVPVAATDPNGVDDTLTFSLINPPTGATIDSATGVITFIPTEAQGGQTLSITVRVADQGGLTAETSFGVTVNEVNSPPVIGAIGTRNVNEGATLSFNIPATDPDVPANTLTYSVVGQLPAGATLDPNTGAFTWTPTEAQGPQTLNVTVRVQDSAGASDEETFQIVVAEVNNAPEIDDIADQAVDEGSELTFTASATDSDTPANTIRFSLGAGAPAGASIDPASGVFRWTPSEAQGPGTFMITIVATDDGGLSDSTTVEVTVREVNTAPSISPISRQTVLQGGALRVNVDALDVDLPANALTFALTDAPEGAGIDPQTGEISWRVPAQQSVGVLSFTVQVSDGAGATDEFTFEVEVQRFDVTALIGSQLDSLVDELQRNNFFEGVGGLGTLDLPAIGRVDVLDPLAPITNGNPIAASTDRLQASNDITLEENAEEEEGDGESERRETRRPTANESNVPSAIPDTPPLRFSNPFEEAGTSAPVDEEASVAPATNDVGDTSALNDDLGFANWLSNSEDAQGHLRAGLSHLAAGVFLAGVAHSACVIEMRHEPTAQEYFEARGEEFVLPKPPPGSSEPAGSAVGVAVSAVAISAPVFVAELAGQRAFYPPPPLRSRRPRRVK
jgi:cyclophilin family peptidyl-prolyl cis-trans isomerase